MLSPTPIVLNAQTVSGITGSISIACWIIVFVPQIYENFYRKSADGLSLLFVILWLAGDVFNVVGALLQHLLPTMIILAAYYTVADIILLIQCLFYGNPNEKAVDPVHLSPANPINEAVLNDIFCENEPLLAASGSHPRDEETQEDEETSIENYNIKSKKLHDLRKHVYNTCIVLCVMLCGFLMWYISYCNNPDNGDGDDTQPPMEDLPLNVLAQTFGYISAALYLGSRVPQILLNFKRKSVEGISFLFFLFACLGNTTFIISVLSISLHPRYLLVNASWLIGSIGTLIMDFIIFIQFFTYGTKTADPLLANEEISQ